MNSHIIQVEQSDDVMITLPDELIKEWNLKPGSKVSIALQDDGSIRISRMVEVEVELEDALFNSVAKMAHDRDITFNEMIQQLLEEYLEGKEGAVPKNVV